MPEPQIELVTERFQCRHIFTDGRRCGSPCLRKPGGAPGESEDFCYFHHTSRRPAQNPRARRSRRGTFALPLPEDRSAIQFTIGQVLQKIASNDIDPRRAGLLLYGLQIASLNLPRTLPIEPAKSTETVEEVTLDPTLGHLAPQTDFTEAREPKGSAERMLEELRAIDTDSVSAQILATVHAVAQAGRCRPFPTASRPAYPFRHDSERLPPRPGCRSRAPRPVPHDGARRANPAASPGLHPQPHA